MACAYKKRKKKNAVFFHEFQDDTYICTILKEKIMHSVNHELSNVQDISFAVIVDIEALKLQSSSQLPFNKYV